jgi:hypothetical protein
MESIYLAGPMSKYPKFNFPAFDEAKKQLSRQGWYVVSPADIDRKAGFNADDKNGNEIIPWKTLHKIIRRDLEALVDCDAIYMLAGWQGSRGARAELAVAEWCGMTVMFERNEDAADYGLAKVFGEKEPAKETLRDIQIPKQKSILETAMEITSGDRRRDYGHPSENFERIVRLWNTYLGIRKKPNEPISIEDCAWMMILMKIARDVNTPQIDNLVDTCGYARTLAIVRGEEE